MDSFVRDKLNHWNLNEFMEIFKEEEVDANRLFCLEDEDIDKLIPKVGPRARFKERLQQLKTGNLSRVYQIQNEEETISTEISFSTSDIGKRKFDLQEESVAEQPAVKRQRASIQFSEEVIRNDVKAIMENVYKRLHDQESTELNEFLKTKIRDLEVDKRAVVGVFGKTGSGKTSLINAVIGVKELLPSGDVVACTSVVIKVEANINNSTYEAEIEFIPKDEWEDELGRFLKKHGERKKHDDDDDDDDDDDGYHDFVEKLSALYGEEWEEKSSELMDIRYFTEIPEFLQSTKKILIFESATELSAKILKFTKQGGDGEIKRCYWPLVKCVTVKVPKRKFFQHVTLVDLPGNGDRNNSRDSMWKGVVGNCSAVWILSEINRAASDKESWEILKKASSLPGNGGECRHIHFICTKSDVIGDLHDHSAADVQAFIHKRNIKAKEAVSKELVKLTQIMNYFSNQRFKVFTVSSAEFLKSKHLNPENTEIPELQDFLQNLNDCQTLNYVSGAQKILSLIQGASLREAVDIPGPLERTLMESIELSLQSEDNSIPDVSTELSMVQKLCNELNSYMNP